MGEGTRPFAINHHLESLKIELLYSAAPLCRYLFPCGREVRGEYQVGSLMGEPGDSLKIRLVPPKLGVWKDFATGDSGNNLLELIHRTRGGDFFSTCREASDFIRSHHSRDIRHFVKKFPQMNDRQPPPLKSHEFRDFIPEQAEHYNALSKTLNIGVDGLLLSTNDGVLKFFDHPVNGQCWSVVDKNHFVRQDRRLDGQQFITKSGGSTKSRTIGCPSWPVGIPTDRPMIVLVEGSSDLLAAYSLIYAEGMYDATPVSMLGASNVIHPDAIQHFKGKYILGFPDYDKAGVTGMTRWQKQLRDVVSAFKIFDYCGLKRDDGKDVKDVRDFLRIDVDQWKDDGDVRSPLCNFFSKTSKRINHYE